MERRPLIVVRVNYSDSVFENGAAVWHQKFFGTDAHELNHYYETISYGRFGFAEAEESDGVQDGIVTVTLNKNHPDYDIGSNTDILNVFQPDMQSALIKTDAAVDYSKYDQDENGAITPDELTIIFILAGNEDAFSGDNASAGVWAHSSCIYSPLSTPNLDGVSLMGCAKSGNYAVFGERHIDPCLYRDAENQCVEYNEDATIGIIAHELGHAAFDLPDLYDTSNASAGIGYFGLMGSGLWGMQSASDTYGNTPTSMMAWSKVQNGWLLPEVVAEEVQSGATLNDTASANYNVLMLPIGDSQCFMLENRSTDGYDAGLNVINGYYRGGMAVWHIDQNVIDDGKLLNIVNADAEHKGVDLEEANEADLAEAGEPGLDDDYRFPGHARSLYWQGNKTNFSVETTPSSRRYDGSNSGVTISNVSAPGPIMQATLTNPNREATP